MVSDPNLASMYLRSHAPLLLLLAACQAPGPFGEPAAWASPIADVLAVGEASFPDGFDRGITTLQVFDGRMWVGYGDAWKNIGSVTPVDFRYFTDPEEPAAQGARVQAEGQGAPQRTPGDTGEEKIVQFRVCHGSLWQPGRDSNNPDEAWTQARDPARLIEGNVFSLEPGPGPPVWRKHRSVPGGEHVQDVAAFQGALYAVGSGADVREEFEGGQVFRYLWESRDGGRSFRTVHRARYPVPGKGDTRFHWLLAVGETLYVFGYLNPFADGGPWEGCSMILRGGELQELEGDLAPLVVRRTVSLGDSLGLAVAGDGSRVFAVEAEGYRELDWGGRHVIDITRAEGGERYWVLSRRGAGSKVHSLHCITAGAVDQLEHVVDLGSEPLTAIAHWGGHLFLGTQDGRVLRAD